MKRVDYLPADDRSCGWFHLSRKRQVSAPHSGYTSAPWVVIGAGLTGLAAARQIAFHYPNEQVILLEAQEVGYGSSGRSSGIAIDLPHDIGAPDYIGDLATAKMNLKLNKAAQEIIKRLVSEHNIECDLRPIGKYEAAVEPRGIAVLDAYRRGLENLGEESEVISEADLPERIGTTFYKKGLFTPGTILLQPASLVKGLADSLPENVTLHENTPVSAVEYGSRITLKHEHGEIVGDKLLLTNNAFASSFGFLKRRLLPIFTYASMTRVLTEEEQFRLGGLPAWGIIPADRLAARCGGPQTIVCWYATVSVSTRMAAATKASSIELCTATGSPSTGASQCCGTSSSNTRGAEPCVWHVITWRILANWLQTCTALSVAGG